VEFLCLALRRLVALRTAAARDCRIHVDFDLSEITDLGNCILGGDGVFPNGPDLLTIAAQVVDTAEVTNAAPFKINGRFNLD